MTKKKIAVVFGSVNSEHDISVASAASVIEHFPVDTFDMIPIYISKTGSWHTGDYSYDALQNNTLSDHDDLMLRFDFENPGFYNVTKQENLNIDAALLVLHGQMGEGGFIQGLMHAANIPFTGSDVFGSALCMDKYYTHLVCESEGIKMAPFQVLDKKTNLDFSTIQYPVIVKPTREGSSYGVTKADNEVELRKAIDFAFEYDSRILIEGFVKGVECGMSIFKTKDRYIISDVDQVNVSGDIFDFQEKYHPHATETLAVSEFPEAVRNETREIGRKVFDLLDCDHFARLDFFITDNHEIILNEVNTMPGFTISSRYPSMIARSGLDYTSMIREVIGDVL